MKGPTLRARAFLVALLMLSCSVVSVVARPSHHLADDTGTPDLEALFPREVGDWRVDAGAAVVLPAPDVQAALDKIYNQTLSRTYVNAQGQRVMLVVAYGGDQSDGTSAHRPEVCYPAQGFEISANRLASLRLPGGTLPVRQLMSRAGQRHEPITYWLVVGDAAVTTGIGQKLAQMRYGLRGVIADGMLVRVSSLGADADEGHRLQARFVSDLAASLAPGSAARVFGARQP